MTEHEARPGRAQSAENGALVGAWLALWNGDLGRAEGLVTEGFVAHAAPLTGTGPDEIRGREALKGWIGGAHAAMRGLSFAIEVGPLFDGECFAVRWRARGTYGGGVPGSAPEAVGREITFTGTDILRVEGGRLAEYWANADSLLFVQQLGIGTVPAR